MKNFLLLILVFLTRISFAQLQFQTDRVFFQNQYISKVSVGLDSNVWVIKSQDSTEIGQVTTSFTEIDLSSAFHGYSSSKFNDILGLDSGIAYVGSQNDYIIRFQSGNFATLNEKSGVANKNVNSIIYSRKSRAFLPMMPRIFIGTDSGEYVSSNRYFFKSLANPDTTYYNRKVKFIVRNCDYDYVHVDLKDSFNEAGSTKYKFRSLTYTPDDKQWDLYTPSDSPPINQQLHTSIAFNYTYNVSRPVGNLSWGTNYGLMIKNHLNSLDYIIEKKNRNIYNLFNLRYFPEEDFTGLKVEDCYLFLGSDSGLYYSHVNRTLFTLDSLILVPNTAHLKIYDIDADFCNTALWLATDQGLVRILVDYTGDYTFPLSVRDDISPRGNIVFCSGDNPFLSGPPMDLNFQWIKNNKNIQGATFQNYIASSPGTYRVIISKNNVCWHLQDTSSAITLDPNQVTISFVHPDTINTCGDYPVPLNTSNQSRYSYQWFKDGIPIPGDTSSQAYVYDQGYYHVRVINCNGIAKNSDSVFIKTHLSVRPTLYKPPFPPLCLGDTVTLGPITAYRIIWYKDNQIQLDYNNKPMYPATASGIYSALTINDFNCIGYSDTVNLIFHSIPSVKIKTDRSLPFCENDIIHATALTMAKNISWSNGEKDTTVLIDHSGKYIASVEENGCLNADTLNAIFYPAPHPDLGKDTTFCEGRLIPIILHAGKDYVKYLWNESETGDSIYQAYRAGVQTLTVFNKYGCASSDTINIYNYCDPYFIPNLITPNGDNKNDFFEIINILPQTELTIYNRWGNKIYYSSDYLNDWSPNDLSSGVYFYSIKNKFIEKEQKGWINVIGQ